MFRETNFQIRKSRRGVPVMLEGKQKLRPTPQGAELAAQLGKSLNVKFRNVFKPSSQPIAQASQQTLVSCFNVSFNIFLRASKLGVCPHALKFQLFLCIFGFMTVQLDLRFKVLVINSCHTIFTRMFCFEIEIRIECMRFNQCSSF